MICQVEKLKSSMKCEYSHVMESIYLWILPHVVDSSTCEYALSMHYTKCTILSKTQTTILAQLMGYEIEYVHF